MARGGITIEDDAWIAANAQLITNNHDMYDRAVLVCKPVLIKRNLGLDTQDVVGWCKNKILDKRSSIIKKVKNWYVSIDDVIITINAYSYTIITAHKQKTI